MKKIVSIFLSLTIMLSLISVIYASNFTNEPYTFEIDYTGNIMEAVEKGIEVKLIGVNGPVYTNALIKVNITGPGTPTLMATDILGTEIDIAQVGYWGPVTGFPVGGDFTNTTPVKATFPVAGTYRIELTLVDLSNNDEVITRRDIDITVLSQETTNTIDELPKTGASIGEYLFYSSIVIIVLSIGYVIMRKRSYES